MTRAAFNIGLLCLALAAICILGGCASSGRQIIARRGVLPNSETARRVAIMPQQMQSPEDKLLERDVIAVLKERGFELVEQGESDLTLTCQVEKNWKSIRHTEHPIYGSPAPPVVGPPGYYTTSGQSYPVAHAETETHVALKGIRLQFYNSASLQVRRFDSAWEGYIEAGFEIRPEEQPQLIRVLLGYYGQDFVGRTKLQESSQ